MLRSSVPLRFEFAWAAAADPAFIRTVPPLSQIGTQDGAASYQTGFVPDNFTPQGAGGVPPFGQDFNGVLNETTSWDQWYQAGGPITYDATFSGQITGYPQGAKVDSSVLLGAQWYSLVDGNTTNPDDPATSSNWARVGVPVGALVPFIGAVPTGYVSLNSGLTIGDASSGAGHAAADAVFLFLYNWPNSQLSIFTSAGAGSSRGANALADWNAHKRLAVPEGRGSGLIGIDNGTTFLNGVPVISGNTTTPGSYLGENLHTLLTSELASHQHAVFLHDPQHTHTSNAGQNNGSANSGGSAPAVNAFTLATINAASTGLTIGSVNGVANDNKTAATGGDGSHNNVERSLGINWGQKL